MTTTVEEEVVPRKVAMEMFHLSIKGREAEDTIMDRVPALIETATTDKETVSQTGKEDTITIQVTGKEIIEIIPIVEGVEGIKGTIHQIHNRATIGSVETTTTGDKFPNHCKHIQSPPTKSQIY